MPADDFLAKDQADMAAVCSPRSMLPDTLPEGFVVATCAGRTFTFL